MIAGTLYQRTHASVMSWGNRYTGPLRQRQIGHRTLPPYTNLSVERLARWAGRSRRNTKSCAAW
jgi:hypothetical protein